MITKDEIKKETAKALLKENMTTIKKNIRKLIKKKGYSQVNVADILQCSQPYVSYFFRRGGNCSIEFLGKMALAFDTTINELLKK